MKTKITKFTSKNPITKEIYLDGDKIKKESGKALSSGLGEVIEVEFSKLGKLMESCSSHEVLCYGTPDVNAFQVTTKDRESIENGRLARTEKNFPFREQPSVFFVDHDPNDNCPKMTPDELHAVFIKVCPEVFKGAAYIERGSVSAGAHKPGDKPKPHSAFHLYYLAAEGTDLKRFSKVLQMRLWEAGYGYILVTAIGAMKANTIIDSCVTQGARLDYTGAPILFDGLQYQVAKTKYHAGKAIDTTKLESLTIVERQTYTAVVAQAKQGCKAESVRKATEWKKNRVGKLVEKGYTKKQAEKEVSSMMKFCLKGKLFGDFEVFFQDFGWASIREIVKDPGKYHDRPLCEPTEDPEEYSNSSARCYVQGRVPIIRSWGHGWNGEKIYLLFKEDPSKKAKAEKIDKKIVEAIEAEIEKPIDVEGNEAWREELRTMVDEMNQSYAVVAVGNVTRIMVTQNNETKFITERDFHLRHRNEKIQVGEKITAGGLLQPVIKTVSEAWLEHYDCEKYLGGVEYAPNQELSKDKFNLWQGMNLDHDADPKAWKRVKKHIEDVVCGGERELIDYFYGWCAYTIQYPERPGYAALVLKGEKGTGKGVMMQFLMSFWKPHTRHITSAEHFIGKFNAHLATCSFLYADEAFFAGDRRHDSNMKGLITEDTIPIERKGHDVEEARNYLRIAMSTNADWVVPATMDERRFAIFEVTNKLLDVKRKSPVEYQKYFRELREEMLDDGVRLGFYNEMIARDISEFHPGNIPKTKALGGQIRESFQTHERWLDECLTRGSWTSISGFQNAEFKTDISKTSLFDFYIEYCTGPAGRHDRHPLSLCMFGRWLNKVFGKKYPGTNRTDLRIKDLQDARLSFQEYYGVAIEPIDNNLVDLAGERLVRRRGKP